jgi:hypothetical protein
MTGVDGSFHRTPSLSIADGVIDIEIALVEAIVGYHLDRMVDYCAFLHLVSARSATVSLKKASSWGTK